MTFDFSTYALIASLAISVLFYLLWKWQKNFVKPYIYFSNLKAFKGIPHLPWVEFPRLLLIMSLILFSIAFLNPRLFFDKPIDPSKGLQRSPTEGIGIYLVLDQSGSMAERISAGSRSNTKVDLLKQVTKQFITGDPNTGLNGRPNDLIGLIAFARGAHVLSPLTLDHAAILSELSTFAPVPQRDQDGTSIGYAIFKTANMIAATKHYAEELESKGEPAYTIKSTVMILITDGMQDPNPLDKGKRLRNMDIPEAAEYTKEQGIRLYIVNVEPRMAMDEFAPHRHIMQRAAELTGGKFYMVGLTSNLEEIYRDIDDLEKSQLPATKQPLNKDQRPDLYQRLLLYPYLVTIGLICLLLSLLLETTIMRRIP